MYNYYSYSYLSHRPNKKRILFCINNSKAIEVVNKIIEVTYFNNIYIYSPNDVDVRSNPLIKVVTLKDIKDLDLANEDMIVTCIDLVNGEDVYKELSNYKIDSILIDYHLENIETFNIWELLRNKSKHITVAKLKSPDKYRVLNYEHKGGVELSVILPVYNVAKYLDQCIKSITKWNAPYVEFLFVDDGSPDNSSELILEASKKDSRIKLLKKENGGCASARQFGLEHSKGKYVSFIDPDDFTDEEMLKKLFIAILDNSSDISYSGYNEYYNDTGISKKVDDLIYEPYSNGTKLKEFINPLIAYLRIGIWRCIFDKKFLESNNISFNVNLRRFDDLPFKVITLLKANNVVSVPEHLYYYRLDRLGQDVKADDEKLFVHFEIFKYLDEWFRMGCTDEQLGYYHVVKIDTHLWALSKLQDRLVHEYMIKARDDLLSLYDTKQLINCVKMYTGRRKIRKIKKILNVK